MQLQIPAKYGELLRKFAPLFVALGNVINQVGPYVLQAWAFLLRVWASVQWLHPQETGPFFFGLVMTFFGGHYLLTFAAIEAYRICGWEKTYESLKVLYTNYLKIKVENDKDNQRDDNNDGIADVKQISSQELVTRKLRLLLVSMDPAEVTSALNGIYMGFMAVVAVLRVQFAQTIALGATIGSLFEQAISKTVEPALRVAMPKDYHKWIPVLTSYGCRILGVSIAWTVQRTISAFYSAIRGAQICLRGFNEYQKKTGNYVFNLDENSLIFTAAVGVLAYFGFWWQLSSYFSLPFPLNVFLAPLTFVEYILTWFVAVEH